MLLGGWPTFMSEGHVLRLNVILREVRPMLKREWDGSSWLHDLVQYLICDDILHYILFQQLHGEGILCAPHRSFQ